MFYIQSNALTTQANDEEKNDIDDYVSGYVYDDSSQEEGDSLHHFNSQTELELLSQFNNTSLQQTMVNYNDEQSHDD